MTNILILSTLTKEETESCIDQMCEGFGSFSLELEVYTGVLSENTGNYYVIYDHKQEGVIFDEAVIFSTTDDISSFKDILSDIPTCSVSGITPSRWAPRNKGKTFGLRNNRLKNFYYSPKEAVFQADPVSLTLIACRALKITRCQLNGKSVSDQVWRTTTNTFVVFTPEEFLAFAEAADEYAEQVFQQSWAELDGF